MKYFYLATRGPRGDAGHEIREGEVERVLSRHGRVRCHPARPPKGVAPSVSPALLVEIESEVAPPDAALAAGPGFEIEPVARFELPWSGPVYSARGDPPVSSTPTGGGPPRAVAAAAGRFEVKVRDPGGQPLAGAQVELWCRDGIGGKRVHPSSRSRTGEDGSAIFTLPPKHRPAEVVVAFYSGYWDTAATIPESALGAITLVCAALPGKGDAWWLSACATVDPSGRLGEGVTIGILDTGVGRHPALARIRSAGAFLPGGREEDDRRCVNQHGTHVAGIIAASDHGPDGIPGIAPGATVYSARVFAAAGDGLPPPIHQNSLAEAVRALSTDPFRADLLNLSLFTATRSALLEQAVDQAFERGTLCVCAAGNVVDEHPPAVCYPAGFGRAIAVAALGQRGRYPPGCYAEKTLPPPPAARVGVDPWVAPAYSLAGDFVRCAAPGSGIVSTVYETEHPPRVAPYAVMSGTSMATAMVTGLLARALAADATWRGLPRGASRAERAREVLDGLCRDVGLAARFQGRGVVSLGPGI